MAKKTTRRLNKNIGTYISLLIGSIVVLIPFFYLFLTCFKTIQESSGAVMTFFPSTNALMENAKFVFSQKDYMYFKFLLNTLFIFLFKTTGVLITCGLAGYAFAKFDCIFSRIFFAMLMAILFVPGELLGIPFYEAMVNLNIRYSELYLPMWIGAWFGIDATIIFLFRQFFITVPNALIEASKIDGAGEFKTYVKIVLPLAKPVIVTTIILNFIGTYNDIYAATLYIRPNEKSTWVMSLSVKIFEDLFKNSSARDYIIPYNYVSIATLLAIIPVVIFFFAAQKNFVESLTGAGLKG